MAEGLDSVDLWLPPEFLVDDYPKENVEEDNPMAVATTIVGPVFPHESDARSPVESAAETESEEEEDYMAGLTRQMAHSFLQDDAEDSPVLVGNMTQNPKFLATSPQSTLSCYRIGSESSRTSHNGRSHISSLLSTPLEQHKDDAWDMLYREGQVSRRRLNGQVEEDRFNGIGLLGPARKTSITTRPKGPSTGSYATPLLTQQQIRSDQLRQLQLMKQQLLGAWGTQSRARGSGGCGNDGSSAWPPLQSPQEQQQPLAGYGMRAVFLSGPSTSTRRTSTGTGVFLPQSTGSQAGVRKKPVACPTVLLPARVVQALNLNLDGICSHPRIPGAFVLAHDAQFARNNSGLSKQTPSHFRSHPAAPVAEETCLPAEWTY